MISDAPQACGCPLPRRHSASLLAPRPTLGWNSWNCFGVDVCEHHVRAVADYMARHLKPLGWDYVVVDAGWYLAEGITTANFKMKRPDQRIDAFGRLLPAIHKFPSAAGSAGFKPLADYVHDCGLKFGLHLMRGIPWQAVELDTPIHGSRHRARSVADPHDTCSWFHGMLGVNPTTAGALDYYRSLASLYADWGVDFIKADDMSYPYHRGEIAALSQSLQESSRPMVLSLSPGPTPIGEIASLGSTAQLWRISPDFWDDWRLLKRQFRLCREWQGVARPGQWPDCDMLPLGRLRITGPDDYSVAEMGLSASEITDEPSRLTPDEQLTLITLWAIFRSPLFAGGYLPDSDPLTRRLLAHPELIALNQHSTGNREWTHDEHSSAWTAVSTLRSARYLALFNLHDTHSLTRTLALSEFGLPAGTPVRDIWAEQELPVDGATAVTVHVPPHGVSLLRCGEDPTASLR